MTNRFGAFGMPRQDLIIFGALVSVSLAAMLGLIVSFKES